MKFECSIFIHCEPDETFIFLRDKEQFQQEPGSPVLVLEKITPGPVGIGTRYREVVQMFPLIKGEIYSTVQRFEPPRYLEETFSGTGMEGYLAYEFIPEEEGTRLIQRETIQFYGMFGFFAPLMERMLLKAIDARLEGIKALLESKPAGKQ
ncbi:MAG: SRPBCC family protein [Anaerolineaceae bacterium]|nr:SRPBCC family protein [Anaerolineaceae bacterium]